MFFLFSQTWPLRRIIRPPKKRKDIDRYNEKAQMRLMLNIAAKSWIDGVPWEESFQIGKDVVEEDECKGKCQGQLMDVQVIS